MQLHPNDIHIWSEALAISAAEAEHYAAILSPDEKARAARFHFARDRERFIAARSGLRRMLSLYLKLPPADIQFSYTDYQKPLLAPQHASALQFNVAHSDAVAVYAFTLHHAVGIDIEKVQQRNNEAELANRFFSTEEKALLAHLPASERHLAFYSPWARKEALIKAVGHGLHISLSTFSVSLHEQPTQLALQGETWTVLPLTIHPDFQSALASNQTINTIYFWKFFDQQPTLDKTLKIAL